MARQSTKPSFASIQAEFADPAYHVRKEAIKRLMRYYRKQAIEPLLAMLQDGRGEVRAAAVQAIGKLKDARALYASSQPQSRDRQMWLVACAPKRCRAPQVVTLTLASLIGVNHAHRWDQARWFWDCRCEAASEEERWGVTDLDLTRLGLENRAENLAFFMERCAQPAPSRADRVSLCLLLQDEGRFEDAFALFNVALTTDVVRLLYQQPLSFHTASQTINRSSTLMKALALAAP